MITTKTIREIQALLRSGLSQHAAAERLGLHTNTVAKYQNDAMAERMRQREKARWELEKANPLMLERRRARAREYQRAMREQRRRRKDTPND